jgi:endo-1,4-beta-xylanase
LTTHFKSLLFILFSFLFISCQPEPVEVCAIENQSLYEHYDFPVGVAIEPIQIAFFNENEPIIRTQFDRLTASNRFKADFIHPEENTFFWTQADLIIEYAEANNKSVHGHTLIWHEQLPIWMENFKGNRNEWEEMMKKHITTIVSRYKSKVKAWDVVNEAFLEDGTLRPNIWYKNMGSSYIEKAFQYAHEADPGALLFYNDFNLALRPAKRKAALDLMKQLKFKGLPIHGIGMQSHIAISYPSELDLALAMQEITDEGFKLHISELDVAVNGNSSSSFKLNSELIQRQAKRYKFVFENYAKLEKQYQYGITIWGINDGESWIPRYFNREDYPLLFDETFKPKPAYCALINN